MILRITKGKIIQSIVVLHPDELLTTNCVYLCIFGQRRRTIRHVADAIVTHYTLYLPALIPLFLFFSLFTPSQSLDLSRILDEQKEKRVEPVPGYIIIFLQPSASTFHENIIITNTFSIHIYIQGVPASFALILNKKVEFLTCLASPAPLEIQDPIESWV